MLQSRFRLSNYHLVTQRNRQIFSLSLIAIVVNIITCKYEKYEELFAITQTWYNRLLDVIKVSS